MLWLAFHSVQFFHVLATKIVKTESIRMKKISMKDRNREIEGGGGVV